MNKDGWGKVSDRQIVVAQFFFAAQTLSVGIDNVPLRDGLDIADGSGQAVSRQNRAKLVQVPHEYDNKTSEWLIHPCCLYAGIAKICKMEGSIVGNFVKEQNSSGIWSIPSYASQVLESHELVVI